MHQNIIGFKRNRICQISESWCYEQNFLIFVRFYGDDSGTRHVFAEYFFPSRRETFAICLLLICNSSGFLSSFQFHIEPLERPGPGSPPFLPQGAGTRGWCRRSTRRPPRGSSILRNSPTTPPAGAIRSSVLRECRSNHHKGRGFFSPPLFDIFAHELVVFFFPVSFSHPCFPRQCFERCTSVVPREGTHFILERSISSPLTHIYIYLFSGVFCCVSINCTLEHNFLAWLIL